jgi:polyisoprenoid-binding protein YceI
MKRTLIALLMCAMTAASAEPVSYTIDPNHTHPMFEADHLGLSKWRGLFRKTTGVVVLDVKAQTGSVDIAIDMTSVDFAQNELTDMAVHSNAPPIFQADKYPVATYRGKLGGFVNGAPTSVDGQLTLHGVTRPVPLRLDSFKCIPDHPLLHREVCGADASATLDRADFGIAVGKKYGYSMAVVLHIQVEAIRDE